MISRLYKKREEKSWDLSSSGFYRWLFKDVRHTNSTVLPVYRSKVALVVLLDNLGRSPPIS